jgi:hypothetical protein
LKTEILDQDLKARNQELIRKSKFHKSVIKFLRDKGMKIAASIWEKIKKKTNQIRIFNLAFDFLYYFIKNNETNAETLTKKEYMEIFIYFLTSPMLREKVLRFLTELIKQSSPANQMIKRDTIKQLIFIASCKNEPLTIQFLQFLKVLVETEKGNLQERQNFVILKLQHSFKTSFESVSFFTMDEILFTDEENLDLYLYSNTGLLFL